MDALKNFLTTKTTQKGVWTCLAIPFLFVCGMVFLGKAEMVDFHQHLETYSKWVIGGFLVSKAYLDRGQPQE